MADGAARFITSDIDPQLFESLCTAHGSESLDSSAAIQAAQPIPAERALRFERTELEN